MTLSTTLANENDIHASEAYSSDYHSLDTASQTDAAKPAAQITPASTAAEILESVYHPGVTTVAQTQVQGFSGLRLTELRSQIESAISTSRQAKADARAAVARASVHQTLDNATAKLAAFRQSVDAPTDPTVTSNLPVAPSDAAPAAQTPIEPDHAVNDVPPVDRAPAVNPPPAINSLLAGTGINPDTFRSALNSILSDPSASTTDVLPLFIDARVGSSLDLTA